MVSELAFYAPDDPNLSAVSTNTSGSSLGTGGMETKLIAAEIATSAGVTTIITSSKKPDNMVGIIEYHNRYTLVPRPQSRATSRAASPNDSGRSSPDPAAKAEPKLPRPPHTVFTASAIPLRDLKAWTSHTLYPAGSVVIDSGAHRVLSKRQSGGRLLAAGVIGVIGTFASGQAVRIVVRKRKEGDEEDDDAADDAYHSGYGTSRPMTPLTKRRLSDSSDEHPDSNSTENEHDEDMAEDDVVEVGRGLANFNSSQVSRVKGLKRYEVYPALKLKSTLC